MSAATDSDENKVITRMLELVQETKGIVPADERKYQIVRRLRPSLPSGTSLLRAVMAWNARDIRETKRER